MPDPFTIAASVAGGLQAINSLFGGGDDVDPQLVALQKEIGQALLKQFKDTSAITTPFQASLAEQLKARTGKKLPISRVNTNAYQPAMQNVVQRALTRGAPQQPQQGGFNLDGSMAQQPASPRSFLGGRATRGSSGSIAPLLIAAMQQQQQQAGGGQQAATQNPTVVNNGNGVIKPINGYEV